MKFRRFLLVFLCLATSLRAQVIISEFLASNSNSIMDENGKHEDWIEITNNTPASVNLLGWYLTDDANQPRQWAFPSMTLNSGAYLVVFASGKDRANPAFNLHTNFKLSAEPGYLALTHDVAGGGVAVVVEFNQYPQQVTDVSYGSSITTTVTPLVASAAAAKTLIPTVGNGGSALGATWRGAAADEPFNTTGWTSGTTAVGFPNTGVPTTNLKVRLNANTAATIVTDSSSAAHNGTNSGATWLTEMMDANGSAHHGALQFNATDANGASTGDQIVVPTNQIDFFGASGTIAFWMKTAGTVADGGATGAMLFDRRDGSGAGFVFYMADDGTLKVIASKLGTIMNSATTAIMVNDDLWHHVALNFDAAAGAACTIYIDGVAAGTQNNTAAWNIIPSQQIELGRSHDPAWHRFNGQFDDFHFYKAPITPAQIQTIANNEDEPVTVGTNVLAAMQNVNPSAFVRTTFNVADPTVFSSVNLTMKWNDGFVAWLNGVQIGSFAAPATPLYDSAATQSHSAGAPFVTGVANPGAILRAGSNVLAIQALNNSVANAVFSALPTLDGLTTTISSGGYLLATSPGTANGAAKGNLGPFVSNVTKNPDPRPTGTAASPPLTINATVIPSLRPLAASNPVKLMYLIMFGAETPVNMTLTATPNVYTANIPTSALGAGQMLRWRVVATDNTAVAGTAPEYSDTLDNEQYYGTVAVDSSIATNLPIFYWFTQNATSADNASGTRSSFFFRAIGEPGIGRFYDNVEINLHGQSSSGFPKKSYDLDFNEDNRFDWDVTQQRVKDINLLTDYGDKSRTHNPLTHEIFAAIGSAAHWAFQVRVQQVTTANAATPANHFFSIADMMEDGDDIWIDRIGRDPNGALYKTYDNLSSSVNSEKKSRTFENKSDLDALIAGIDPSKTMSARRLYAYDNLDLPQCVSYFAGCAITSHQDHGHKNFYVYRDTPNTREWSIMPWDIDLTLGRNWTDANGYFTDTISGTNVLNLYPGYNDGGTQGSVQNKGDMNRLYSLMFDCPEFRKMYLRRLRTAMDTYLGVPGYLEGRVDAMTNAMDPPAFGVSDADRDLTKWGTWNLGNNGGNTAGGAVLRYHTDILKTGYLAARRTFLNSANAKLYYTGGAFETIPAAQPLNAADLITIETIDYNPASGTQDHEYFVLRNANAYPVDISGWKITGAVAMTFKPGTVLPAGAGATQHIGDLFVARNPFGFRQRPNGPTGGQFCFVQGPYVGQLSARGETIELRAADDTLLKTKSWPGTATPMQNALRISELNYAPQPPSVAESAALPGAVESDFEYIELMNIGGSTLTLTGAHFDEGITFTFPAYTLAAGARCLLVSNLAAFQLRYGHGFDAQIAGVFGGNLDNNGENIQLLDNVGENILDFTYNNSWFPPSDEGGRTIVVRDVNAVWSSYGNATNWALSGAVSGSPGTADADFANVYEGWRYDYFTELEFPTLANPNAPAALTVDLETDGLNNLAEYAFGRNPRLEDASAVATSRLVTVGGTEYGAIVFTRRHKALDLTYTVEVTGDFGSWTPVDLPVSIPGVAPLDLGNGVEQVAYRDSQPASSGKRFLRVRAVK